MLAVVTVFVCVAHADEFASASHTVFLVAAGG